MPVPEDLTFGVFDAAAIEKPISSPVVLMCQVQVRANKVFASLIDGGSALNSNNKTTRFLTRSTTAGMGCCENGEIPKPGDIVQLSDYSARRISGKSEIVFVILKMHIVRHCPTAFEGLEGTLPYPYENAASRLHIESPLLSNNFPENETNKTQSKLQVKDEEKNNFTKHLLFNTENNNTALLKENMPKVTISSSSYSAVRKPENVSEEEGNDYERCQPYPVTPQFKLSGPVSRRIDGQFIEIKNLTSFLGRWVVKGRFINKGEPRTYCNPKGEGKIWNCDLMDSVEPGGTIRCTFFNKAVTKFYPFIKENEVYTVSRGVLKPANRKYNTGSHQFEIQLGEDAKINWIGADDPTLPAKPKVAVSLISNVAQLSKYSIVSVCGVILRVSEISQVITRATGVPRERREVTICDQSETSIAVTLWGNKCSLIDQKNMPDSSSEGFSIVLFENARVDEFNGRKLSSVNSTEIIVNPSQMAEITQPLINWYRNVTASNRDFQKDLTSLSSAAWFGENKLLDHVTIAELRKRTIEAPERDLEDKGCWFYCTATLLNIEKDRQFFWVACPTCGRKITSSYEQQGEENRGDDAENVGYCVNCAKDIDKPTRKYNLQIEIVDATASLRCQAMGDKGLLVMGNVTPDYLVSIQNKGYGVYQRYDDYFLQRLRREYVFKIQAKSETYRDETRIRYRIFGVESLNAFVKSDSSTGANLNDLKTCQANLRTECRRLLESIRVKLQTNGSV